MTKAGNSPDAARLATYSYGLSNQTLYSRGLQGYMQGRGAQGAAYLRMQGGGEGRPKATCRG